jgi:hypothetical protein
MPPKRILKPGGPKPIPKPLNADNSEQQSQESIDAELKFDQEVLWCVSQFEKLLNSGKLPEAKSEKFCRFINENNV